MSVPSSISFATITSSKRQHRASITWSALPYRAQSRFHPQLRRALPVWGAHLLLQARVKTLNQELGMVFQRWYPDLQLEEPLAA